MKRGPLARIAAICVTLAVLYGCTGGTRKLPPAYGDLGTLIDSICATPTKAGKYGLTSGFFEKVAALRQAEGADSARSVLLTFFSRLQAKIMVTDSLAVFQVVEWIYNCFTMMDSGGVFFANGAADTYAAWYLQRVEGIRPDLMVISLQFLVGVDYREFLLEDGEVRSALNLTRDDSLPVPPSTSETRDALEEIIIRSVKEPNHPPLYLAPFCGVAGRFGGYVVDLGLVFAYQDSVQSQNHILDQLISKLTQNWRLHYASQGAPKDSSYAARVAWLQYLTLLIRMAPEFEKAGCYSDLDTLFAYLEPVVGEDWRFPMLKYMCCHQAEEECGEYRERVKKYAADHPDDRAVQAALKQLEAK